MRIWEAMKRNSLWLMSIGLMAASSGVDGAYMSTWMPRRAYWLGYVLNTTSDVASEVLMYWFGRLQQERKGSKKWRFSWWLLPAEVVIVTFSWFFSWRQLRIVMPAVEGAAAAWVAPISAAFAPILLASIGYAQALLAGKFEDADMSTFSTQRERHSEPISEASEPVKRIEQESEAESALRCPYCGATANARGEPFRSQQAVSAHMRWCEAEESDK